MDILAQRRLPVAERRNARAPEFLATEARIVPHFEGGKGAGFKLFSIRPGSIYSKIGITNGDVIQRINGEDIDSPDKAFDAWRRLKDASSIQIELSRGGTKKKNVWLQLARYSQLAFVLPTATVVGWLVGAALDRWLGTKWMYLAGLVLGIAAGFIELVRTVTSSEDS